MINITLEHLKRHPMAKDKQKDNAWRDFFLFVVFVVGKQHRGANII